MNLAKSKVMCLSKQKKTTDACFTFAEGELQKVENYTYLSSEISKTASFNLAQNALADKTNGPTFKNMLSTSSLRGLHELNIV